MGWPGSHENRRRRVFSPGTVLLDVDEFVLKDWRGAEVNITEHEKRNFFYQLDGGVDFQDTEYFSIMLKVKRQVEAEGRSLDLVEFFEHKLKLWRHFEEFCADSRPTVRWDVRRRVWVLTDGAHRTCLGASRGRTSFEFAMHLWI